MTMEKTNIKLLAVLIFGRGATMGYLYLLHFSQPFGTPQTDEKRAQYGLCPRKRQDIRGVKHYLGYAESDIVQRVHEHENGQGAALTRAAHNVGVTFTIARTWDNATRKTERRLKNHKNHARLCPLCNPRAENRGKF